MRISTGIPVMAAMLFLTAMGVAQTTFKGRGSAAPASKYHYTLTLHKGGRAFLSIIFSRRRRMTAMAKWKKPTNDEIVLQFVTRLGEPRGKPTIWHQDGRKLTPVSWGKDEWVEAPPPVLHRD